MQLSCRDFRSTNPWNLYQLPLNIFFLTQEQLRSFFYAFFANSLLERILSLSKQYRDVGIVTSSTEAKSNVFP